MIDCIIQRHKAEPSNEHIIPEAIGGKLITRKACTKCNNDYCSKLDVALSDNRVMLLARHQFKIPGYDVGDRVFGKGTLPDGTDVNVKFDKALGAFVPKVRGAKIKTEKEDGTAEIAWIMPPGTHANDLLDATRKELAKHGEVDLPDAEVLARMDFQEKTIINPSVTVQMQIDLIALTLAGLKMAYEYTAEVIGYDYLKDSVADEARDLLLAGIPQTQESRERFSCGIGGLQFAGNNAHSSQHKLILCRQGRQLVAAISLFETFIGKYTMSDTASAYSPFEASIHQIDVLNGQRIDYRIPSSS